MRARITMIPASVLVALLALTGAAASQDDFELCAAPSTVQVGPNSTCASLGALATSTVDIAAAPGEYEHVQLLVRSPSGASSASVSVAALACRAVNRRIDVLLRQKYALEATSISPAMSKMSAARAAWVELLDACAAAAQFEKLPCGFITMSTDRRRTRESSNFHCVAGIVRQGSVSMLRAATPLEDAWKRMEDLSSEGLLVTDFAVETSAVEEVLFCAGALLRAALVASEDTRDLVRSVAGMQPLLMLGRDDMNDDDDGSSNTNIGVEALASLQQLSMSLDRDGSGTAGRAIRQLTSHLRRHGASGFRAPRRPGKSSPAAASAEAGRGG